MLRAFAFIFRNIADFLLMRQVADEFFLMALLLLASVSLNLGFLKLRLRLTGTGLCLDLCLIEQVELCRIGKDAGLL